MNPENACRLLSLRRRLHCPWWVSADLCFHRSRLSLHHCSQRLLRLAVAAQFDEIQRARSIFSSSSPGRGPFPSRPSIRSAMRGALTGLLGYWRTRLSRGLHRHLLDHRLGVAPIFEIFYLISAPTPPQLVKQTAQSVDVAKELGHVAAGHGKDAIVRFAVQSVLSPPGMWTCWTRSNAVRRRRLSGWRRQPKRWPSIRSPRRPSG